MKESNLRHWRSCFQMLILFLSMRCISSRWLCWRQHGLCRSHGCVTKATQCFLRDWKEAERGDPSYIDVQVQKQLVSQRNDHCWKPSHHLNSTTNFTDTMNSAMPRHQHTHPFLSGQDRTKADLRTEAPIAFPARWIHPLISHWSHMETNTRW